MEIIAIKKRKWKQKVSQGRIALKEKMLLENIRDTDVRVALIQALIPEGLKAVNEKLQEEVRNTGGEKAPARQGKRALRQGGSVYLMDQKIPIEVPRVRNKLAIPKFLWNTTKIPRAL